MVKQPPTSWLDLLDPTYKGKVVAFDYGFNQLLLPIAYAMGGSSKNDEDAWKAITKAARDNPERTTEQFPSSSQGFVPFVTLVNSSVNVFLGQGLGALSCWLEEIVRRPKLAALVPTAANPLPDAPWVQQVATRLKACGVSVEQLDLQDATRPTVATVLAGVDLVFVTGGYPIFLLEQAQRTGFIDLVREDARQGRLAYAGMSAGASLAGPDLALYRAPDDPGAVTSTAGLALSPFFPLTHANRGRQEWYSSIIAANPESRFVTITDEQAVVIAGDAWDLRASPIIDE